MKKDPKSILDRRRFLMYGGAASTVTLVGCLSDDDDAPADDDPDDDPDDGIAETFELNGITGGWVGIAPEGIVDETNPTLELEAGETYRVIWTNGDGNPHDFVILDAAGDRIVGTEIFSDEGERHELEFEATEEMVEYYCSVHPNTMRGDIDIEGVDAPSAPEGVTLIDEGPTVGLETVAEGLSSPTDLAIAPGEEDKRYIVDQPGMIYTHTSDGVEEFMDITDRVDELNPDFDERGLLGLAFHPQFQDEEHRKLYVRYSAELREDMPEDWSHTSVVAEFEATGDGMQGDPESERIILEYANPQFNHNAGPLEFGPDGLLYIATGDGGGADDVGPGHVDDWYDENEGGNGQDTTQNLLGGILRIDVDDQDEGLEYAIPPDNPLVDEEEHLDEYYAWGLRNPWGMTFDQETGELLAADVGQRLFEIINRIERGGNYGWNVMEGTHCFSTETPDLPPSECPQETPADVRGGEPLLGPIIEYPQYYDVATIGSAIVGGDMYRTDTIPELEDTYIFGDWSGELAGTLFVAYPPEGWPEETVPERDFRDQTDGHDSELFQEERWEGLWPIDELLVEADEALVHEDDENRLGHFVLGVERGHAGEMYVLTNDSAGPLGDGGMVHRIVPPDGA